MRRKLVRTLYTQPTSLAIGALNGIACAVVVALWSQHTTILIACICLGIVALARLVLAYRISPDDERRSARQLEVVFEIGAFTYAFLLGLITALTMLHRVEASVEVLMVANAACYGVGICARNAGRPFIALGQLLLTCTPIIIAAFYIGSTPFVLLGITMLLLLPAMGGITLKVFEELRESISAAEASRKLAEKMRVLARTDVVTGLANRAGHNQDIAERLMAIQPGDMIAVFWLDLDRFKEVNDVLGHAMGDRVLQEISARLLEAAPADATVSRFGGDEFIIVCNINDRKSCERLAADILAETLRPVRLDNERLEVGSSIGIALLPDDGVDAETLMQNADLALYHAKVNGRKQTRFYDSAMSRELVRKREIEAELRAAIQKDELSIFFQPIVDLESGRIRCFEALVRWFHPVKGELPPSEFIPVAEETGAIVTLGNWITAQAAKAAAQWPDDITLAVNLSPLQIKAPGAALGILSAIREAGLPPERLELEVTESLFIDDHSATEHFIQELSDAGVRFALDDFGTGYSSLGYIQKYPFRKIKVDRSFVSGPDVGKKADAIIHAVAELGSKLDMDIVAEGLETIDQVHSVRNAGCTLGQGYYFSRPVPDYLAAMLLAQENDEASTGRAVA